MKFGYARVSTLHQNLDLQIDALNKYGADRIYQEKISSVKERPELNELLKVLREGDSVVVWRIDRLGRNVKELIELVENFDKRGVHLVSLQENFDTSTSIGKCVFTIICSIAQMEREMIVEKTKAGQQSARTRGQVFGRPKINKQTRDEIKDLYYINKLSVKKIVELTKVGRSTVYEILKEN